MSCQRESCQRHDRCMYIPCEAPSYADVKAGGPTDMNAEPSRKVVVSSGRQQGKTHALRIQRLRAIAKGATINGTYRMEPIAALDAFRADLLALVGDR